MMVSMFRRGAVLALGAGLALVAMSAQAASKLRVAYAGSMGVVMDHGAGPAFAKRHDVNYQGIGHGSYALARLLASKQMRADVFVGITPGPVKLLQKAGLVGRAVPVASTQMVITYSPKSRFARQFKAAAAGKMPWYQVLERQGLRFGRTDPATDPQGRNIIFTMQLAQLRYKQPGLLKNVLGSIRNPQQIFSETSLLSRLEAGQLDASSGYLSAARSHHLPVIRLPDAINLSNPAMAKRWYNKASFKLDGKMLRVQPLVFYAAVLKNARHPKQARAFVDFLQSPAGQKLLAQYGYSKPKGGAL
ncbi:extracellular solute-binding protein [Oleiagrimonas sp. C23AA]|uniref:extracellular solute-binding protein n=1 Tax=Oleiagrimonas sp. C23AA TaxID=2719047 RepID=UPI00197DCA2B|nr:extracellular solute-binding protein [Oleiagrimonas sp. C23AA]